jgi:hypothetical protein
MMDRDNWHKRLDTCSEMEDLFEWDKWMKEIPFLNFPSHWQVKIIPPVTWAIIRFRIRTDKMQEGRSISVYLDCYDMLGCVGEPYWEIYDGDECYRFLLKNHQEMLDQIAVCLEIQENVKSD